MNKLTFPNCISDPKSRYIMQMIVEGNNTRQIDPAFRRLNMGFKIYGSHTSEAAGKCTPERHVMRMFKILYMSNTIFNDNLLELITYIYLWHTRNTLWKQIKSVIPETSAFASTIGDNRMSRCAGIYRETYPYLKTTVPRAIDESAALMNVMDAFDFISSEGCMIMSDPESGAYFDYLVKRGKPAFHTRDGIVYPVKKDIDWNKGDFSYD